MRAGGLLARSSAALYGGAARSGAQGSSSSEAEATATETEGEQAGRSSVRRRSEPPGVTSASETEGTASEAEGGRSSVRRRSRKSSAAEREAAVAALAGRAVLLEAKAHCKAASAF